MMDIYCGKIYPSIPDSKCAVRGDVGQSARLFSVSLECQKPVVGVDCYRSRTSDCLCPLPVKLDPRNTFLYGLIPRAGHQC